MVFLLFFLFFGLFLTQEPELCEATSSCEPSLVGSRSSFHLGRVVLILLEICRRTRAAFILAALIKGSEKNTNWRKSPDKTNILALQIAPRMITQLLSWWEAASSSSFPSKDAEGADEDLSLPSLKGCSTPVLLGFLQECVQDLHPELCRRILALPGGVKEGTEQRKKKLKRKESKAWNESVLWCLG